MRAVVGIVGLLAACSFDTGVANSLEGSIDGSFASDDGALSSIDAAGAGSDSAVAVDDAAMGAADATPDAFVAPIVYSLVPTGSVNVQANFGGAGGGAFSEDCPDGRVVTGFDGDNTSNGVCRVNAFCSLLTANPDGSVVTSDPIATPIHGSSGSFVLENPLLCPANAVVVAANGRVSSDIVREFQISCAPLTWDYASTVYTVGATTQVSGNIGTGTGSSSSGACASGEVAGGFGGSAGTLLDRFELHCFQLAPVPQ